VKTIDQKLQELDILTGKTGGGYCSNTGLAWRSECLGRKDLRFLLGALEKKIPKSEY